MNTLQLQKVALRQRAVFIENVAENNDFSPCAADFCAEMYKLGYVPDEKLLHALNGVNKEQLSDIYAVVKEVLGLDKNWTPLVKGWLTPTGESRADHLITAFANFIDGGKNIIDGVRMPCGHLIPKGTFPIERYNGCPFCGTPFEFSDEVFKNQASKRKVLTLWTLADVEKFFKNLLSSPVALDATQRDSLKILLANLPLPENPQVTVKENVVLIVDTLLEQERPEVATRFFSSPDDIMRYLWYKKTAQIQIIKPKILLKNAACSVGYFWGTTTEQKAEKTNKAVEKKRNELKLHFSRKMCRIVANWLNSLKMNVVTAAEIMHPKRGMWVRFIRALRLSEFAKQQGFEKLKTLLDIFYRQDYKVWQSEVNAFIGNGDVDSATRLLQQRPGSFARQLFSTILHSGKSDFVFDRFKEIADKLPPRLLITLGMYAEMYFDSTKKRSVKAITGKSKRIENPKLLNKLSDKDIRCIIESIQSIYNDVMYKRFKNTPTEVKTMYIDPQLFDIPLSVGERSATIQDTSCALQGTKFDVEGNSVRLFMGWGKGLPAQWLDMDLSAVIIYQSRKQQECAYYHLSFEGTKHSGDIRHIPDQIGTAEYIELDINKLRETDAKYAIFTCNAYSNGNISPNLVVGWMDSKFPMKVSDATGVAYDPSCVQHQVRISEANLSKGLVFGVLDIDTAKITWLEMPFGGQIARNVDLETLEGFLQKLSARTSIGEILKIKANAQNIQIVDNQLDAEEVFDYQWALDTAKVSGLLMG